MKKKEILAKYELAKKENPGLRFRDLSSIVGVSEGELLSSVDDHNVLLIDISMTELVKKLSSLGYVMALSRNNSSVMESKGNYPSPQIMGNMGITLGKLDFRLFLSDWKYAYAVEKEQGGRILKSIQFFDKAGDAVHKVYLQESSNFTAYEQILKDYGKQDYDIMEVEVKTIKEYSKPNSIDYSKLEADWSELKDTHDFVELLRRYNLKRIDALKIIKDEYAKKISNGTIVDLLFDVSIDKIPIMIFTSNTGIVHIYSGEVQNIKLIENWINVLDPEFNLHFRTDTIGETYLVRKPTIDGIVTSIEIYDYDGELAIQFFGERKPGSKERVDWRNLAESYD